MVWSSGGQLREVFLDSISVWTFRSHAIPNTITFQSSIIAVGFKVNSERAVQFRKWVNQIAKDYTIKGWVMDDERLKRGTYLTEKYFDEQLERIREIRASERKFYQKITDLYATAIDYDKEVCG